MRQGEHVTSVVRPLRDGQVTIPAEFRRALGIDGDALLHLTLVEGELRIRLAKGVPESATPAWLRDAYEAFAPIREELARTYSSDEIDDAVDRAVNAVRRPNAPSGL